MELPFSAYDFLATLERYPHIMVFFAGFYVVGLLLVMLILSLILWPLRKLTGWKQSTIFYSWQFVVVAVLVITWIAGAFSQLVLLFMEVSGIKLLMIYLVMYLTVIAFVLTNKNALRKLYNAKVIARLPKKNNS